MKNIQYTPFFHSSLFYICLGYFLLRLLSFLTWTNSLENQILAGLLVATFAVVAVKKLPLAWTILLGEILLDGAGHFFELSGFLLRTWLLGIFALVWLVRTKEKNLFGRLPKGIRVGIIFSGVFLLIATINGFIHNHSPINILQDIILFLFLLLLFPALELQKNISPALVKIIQAFILASAIFSLCTFILYSSGLGTLPDDYYHWFRNIAAGKITDLGNYFFRIVLPEHLFIVPAFLVSAALLMKEPKNKKVWFFTLCAAFVLALNFTRIYFVGLAIGFLVLAYKENLKRWFTISALMTFSILFLFMFTHLLASRGHSFGLELVGLRLGGAAAPSREVSGAIRLAILPDALRQIKEKPLLGSGLGATVTYTHPVTKEVETRTQFDWGYLEMLAEFGMLGTAAFLAFLFIILSHLARLAYKPVPPLNSLDPLLRGLLAGAAALFVINSTTPALFHGFGILYFAALVFISSPTYSSSLPSSINSHADGSS